MAGREAIPTALPVWFAGGLPEDTGDESLVE
jgi:hypothetical protein